MFRALTANLVLHESIETTDAKAKELRRIAERLITKARRLGKVAYTPWADLGPADRSKRSAAKKDVGSFLRRIGVKEDATASEQVDLVEKVFTVLAKRYADRPGGYTRITKLGPRRGDNAPMSVIELVDRPVSKVAPTATKAAPAEPAGVEPAP
jgi:large subunit ribosomal protein L17